MKEDFKKGYYYECFYDDGFRLVVKCTKDCSYRKSVSVGFKGVVVGRTKESNMYPQIGYFCSTWDGEKFKHVYDKIADHYYACNKGITKPIVKCILNSRDTSTFKGIRISIDDSKYYVEDYYGSDYYSIDLGTDLDAAIAEWKLMNSECNQEPELNVIL